MATGRATATGRRVTRRRAAATVVLTVAVTLGSGLAGAAPASGATEVPTVPTAAPGGAAGGGTTTGTSTDGAAAGGGAAVTPSSLPDEAPVAPSIAPVAMAPSPRSADGSREADATTPLKMVAVTWAGTPPDVVEVRTKDDTGRFGDWSSLDTAGAQRDDAPARSTGGGTEPIWVGDRSAVEVRATRAGQSVTDDVSVLRIDPGTSPNDAAIARSARAATAPTYVTRAQWGADPRLQTWSPEVLPAVRAVTIHHTAGSNNYTAADSAAIVRGIYAYHSRTQGWGDIGYNALVDRFGTIFEGRAGGMDKAVVAAHAGGFNRGTWGIAMMGNLVSTPPTAAETESVARLAAWKLRTLDPNAPVALTSTGGGTSKYAKGRVATVPTLFGHRDVGNTECPGNAGYGTLGTVRARVKVLEAGTTTPTTTPARPTTTTPATTTPARPATPATGAATTVPGIPTGPGTVPDQRQLWGPGEPYLRAGATAGGRGRYNDYAWGSVYWSPTTGGWEIYGAIRDFWRARGAESSPLGYPTSNEYDVAGGRQQNFERGVLRWLSATGAVFSPTP